MVAAGRDISVDPVNNVPDLKKISPPVSGNKIDMFYVARMQVELFSMRRAVMFVKQ